MASLGHNEFFDLISCLVQNCSIFISGVLEVLHSLTQQTIYSSVFQHFLLNPLFLYDRVPSVVSQWCWKPRKMAKGKPQVWGCLRQKNHQNFYTLPLGPSGMSIETTIVEKRQSWSVLCGMGHVVEGQEDKDKDRSYIIHSCWWPGDARSQGISRHDFDPIHVLNSLGLVACRYQAIPWTSVDFSLMTFCDILIREQFHSECSSYYFV